MARAPSSVVKVVVGASIALLALVSRNEGTRYTAYPDLARGWALPTICNGHTQGVKRGDVATPAQCTEYLKQDTAEAVRTVLSLVRVPLNQNELDAYADFVFNAGAGNFRTSTMLRKLNAGDHVGACNELTRWVNANGKTLPGLVKRRAEELKLCLS
jgi:lysozyme